MRKIALLLLLAGAAMPAMAQDEGDGVRRHQQSSENDGDSGRQRSFGGRSSDDGVSAARAERMQQRMERQRDERAGGMPVQSQGVVNREVFRGGNEAGQVRQADAMQRVREWRERQAQQGATANGTVTVHTQGGGGYMPRQGRYRSVPDTNVATQVFNGQPGVVPAPGAQMPPRAERDSHWSGDWRRDSRYDWQRWRDRHRSVFRIGFYYDPFGWNYRRYSIGSVIWPSYYQADYWLNDPWQYRLPPAYGPFRWVRYWDDALLVNIYTGEVVDVIRNFFW